MLRATRRNTTLSRRAEHKIKTKQIERAWCLNRFEIRLNQLWTVNSSENNTEKHILIHLQVNVYLPHCVFIIFCLLYFTGPYLNIYFDLYLIGSFTPDTFTLEFVLSRYCSNCNFVFNQVRYSIWKLHLTDIFMTFLKINCHCLIRSILSRYDAFKL